METGTILVAAVGGLWTLVIVLALSTLRRMEKTLEKLFELHDKHDEKLGEHGDRLTTIEVSCSNRHNKREPVEV